MADKQEKSTHETQFHGPVRGQIHTGSGNINASRNAEGTSTDDAVADIEPAGNSGEFAEPAIETPKEMAAHQTVFRGPVSGQIHTGSGNINIGRAAGDALVKDVVAGPAQLGVDAAGDVIVVEPESRKVVAKVPQQSAYERIAEAANHTRTQLEQIYEQDRGQAQQWFRFSLIAATLGLLIIIGAVIALLAGSSTAALVTAVASTITEAIAALFFRQAGAANKRLDDSRKELIKAEGSHRAIALAETIDDDTTQQRLKELIILQTLGLPAKGQEILASTANEEK